MLQFSRRALFYKVMWCIGSICKCCNINEDKIKQLYNIKNYQFQITVTFCGFLIGTVDFFTDVYYILYVPFESSVLWNLCLFFLVANSVIHVVVMPAIYLCFRNTVFFKRYELCNDSKTFEKEVINYMKFIPLLLPIFASQFHLFVILLVVNLRYSEIFESFR